MPSGTPSGKGLYLTIYPLSGPNTDTMLIWAWDGKSWDQVVTQYVLSQFYPRFKLFCGSVKQYVVSLSDKNEIQRENQSKEKKKNISKTC